MPEAASGVLMHKCYPLERDTGGSSALSPRAPTCSSYPLGAGIGQSLEITPDGSRDVAAEPYKPEEVS
jgi:hypothetical protein